jgi:high-affinity nickel-transport protein
MIPNVSRRRIAVTAASLIALNVMIWLWAGYAFRDRPGLLGTALLAWVFGLRHAVDADHIAAIDNVVRKLVHDRRRAWDSGLFFALGHSATVLILCLCIAAMPGIERLRGAANEWGTLFSAVFLLLIGMVNLVTLRRIWRARHGVAPDTLRPVGAMSRVLLPVQRLVGRTWHMVPVGFLFGLGFDTASEVALLVLTAQQAAAGLSPADVLIFPVLFAGGMMLIDTADSAVMTGAYNWALHKPARKLGYNMAVTAVSVFVAAGIGGIELLGLLAAHVRGMAGLMPFVTQRLDGLVTGPFAGFTVVAALLLLWGIAALASRSRARIAE